MRYIITGATSFIGSELIRLIIEREDEVYAICRKNTSIDQLPKGRFLHLVYADMSNYGELYKKIPKADIFINLAWGGTNHDGRKIVDVQNENITNTIAAMTAAERMGCKIFVESGSQAEYGSTISRQQEENPCFPFSEYGKAKLKVKEELFNISEKLNIKYIHLRIFSVFGENDHPWTLVMTAINKMLHNEIVDLSPCTQNWNFIYVKDAARIIISLCEYATKNDSFKHEVYNIASEDTRPLKAFVEQMKKLVGSSSELNYGAINPPNIVSLQPDMSKTKSVVGSISEYTFDEVIKKIIYLKTKKHD